MVHVKETNENKDTGAYMLQSAYMLQGNCSFSAKHLKVSLLCSKFTSHESHDESSRTIRGNNNSRTRINLI